MRAHIHFLKRILAYFSIVCTALLPAARTQGWETVKLDDSPAVIEPAVTYVSQEPVIDGTLDEQLRSLPVRRFSVVEKSAPGNPDFSLSYRLAYGTHFLYIYIEVEADELVYRDRAYQKGDGFTVVLARPQPERAPSREFYVLACSAVDRKSMEWTRKIFWYYNVDNIFLPTSDDMKTAFLDGDGTISFELLLPWQDVHPYHPWLGGGIGFNLGMAKAVGEKDLNWYKVIDAGIGDENSPREYALLRFEEPRHEGDPQTFVLLDRNNIFVGDTLHARSVTAASKSFTENLRILVQTGEKANVDYVSASYECGPGLTFEDITLGSDRQSAGGYLAKWSSPVSGSSGESGLSILPPFDAPELNRMLDNVKSALSPGSYTTLQFTIEEIDTELRELHPYETAAAPRLRLTRLIDYIQKAGEGIDQLARRREFVRMAYRSTLDNTFQPYVVWIPKDYDPRKKYPLLVYLHGSASTEHDIMGIRALPEGFIALGPRGRGPSNWWSLDNAQTDVAEAVQSVKENFSIDGSNVFLAGFSMGGYGVYRTFYETPGTYKAIAVFSGTPRVKFSTPDGAEMMDFNEKRYLERFKGVPVFVFHGKRDLNVPYEETEQFIGKLERAGALVEFHSEDDKGHESPSEETINAFFRWIRAQIET